MAQYEPSGSGGGGPGPTGPTGPAGPTGPTGPAGVSLGPLEISESGATAFMLASGDFLQQTNGGAFIECTFANWNAGDILQAYMFIAWKAFNADPTFVTSWIAVSTDNGVTFDVLVPAANMWNAPVGGDSANASVTATASVACAVKPIVRIGITLFSGLPGVDPSVGGTGAFSGSFLRCQRFAAGSYTPAGSLVPIA